MGFNWFFGKHRFPRDSFECNKPQRQEPPADLAVAVDFQKPPNAAASTPLSPKMANREAFMVCFLTQQANEAATFYKQQSCPGTANYDKLKKMVVFFKQYQSENGERT